MLQTLTSNQIPLDLFYKFNAIKFHDDIHKYYYNGENFISVTTILHKFEEEFDVHHWSEVKSFEYDIPQLDIMEMWNAWNLKSTIKGSAIHNYAELKYNNKVFKFTQADVDLKLGEKYKKILVDYPVIYKDKVDSGLISKMEGYTIMEEYEQVKKFVDKFYEDTFEILIPVKAEFIVYDIAWKIAGMLDMLFWNTKYQCFQIWDWKTNKEFTMRNDFNKKLKPPFNKLDECHFEKYSLQLSTYKTIIERNTDIKINGLYVVHLNEKNPTYKWIKCNDYSSEMTNFLQKRIF